MAVDPRQVLAGLLTVSMFAMVGNMIKRDHFDSIEVSLQDVSGVTVDVFKAEETSITHALRASQGQRELKPCWNRPVSKDVDQSQGYITFSLRSGPEYHVLQVTDAVVIARYLGATLVLPDIRGGRQRNFRDMYDADKFVHSLSGVVNVVDQLPAEVAAQMPSLVRVPHGVSEDFIVQNIEPIFQTGHYLRLASYFTSVDWRRREKRNGDLDSTACLAMFGSLELKQGIAEAADGVVERLRTLSRNIGSRRFIAIDLRSDALEKRGCKESDGRSKACFGARETAEFLRRIGFNGDDPIYVTQTRWDESLDPLKEFFPRSYTKDDLMPAEKKGDLVSSGSQVERALDLLVCAQSDVFVPAISGLFYANVAGRRIASGRPEMVVPSRGPPPFSATASDFISSYVSRKNHVAYSCYC
ncbi:hypothetical protein OPV22_006416 [Ensete ventricosum]|uniref:O-fucosyltransferase family protein n=1 Tax=Ensete ventricosum TaxID=4639 RepID=A0AAV8RT86_ENSVE|nr:hypothetical protein OPV22_006416 [Ensete ventricosum]